MDEHQEQPQAEQMPRESDANAEEQLPPLQLPPHTPSTDFVVTELSAEEASIFDS